MFDLPLLLVPYQLIVEFVVRICHNHLHLVGELIRVGHIPAGVDPVQLSLIHVRHTVLTHVLIRVRARASGPSVGAQRQTDREIN